MKYQIKSTTWDNIEQLIKHYPCLIKFGFEIDIQLVDREIPVEDENGNIVKFIYGDEVLNTSFITIDDLDEIRELAEMVKSPLIIFEDDEPTIEIYDGYRE